MLRISKYFLTRYASSVSFVLGFILAAIGSTVGLWALAILGGAITFVCPGMLSLFLRHRPSGGLLTLIGVAVSTIALLFLIGADMLMLTPAVAMFILLVIPVITIAVIARLFWLARAVWTGRVIADLSTFIFAIILGAIALIVLVTCAVMFGFLIAAG